MRAIVASVLSLIPTGVNTAGEQQLTRTELAKLGKAATVLVELRAGRGQVSGQGYGSAFCVHRSGLFVTNEHVVHPPNPFPGNPQGAESEVTLVVNPGQDNERSYAAQVIRTDKQLDLALLRVDGTHNFPTLSLGDDEKLEELMDVVAFGFPFGPGIAGAAGQPIGQPQVPGRREYPSVSANAGGVTALRRKEGKLDRIQLDATINPGNSGGPVLDKEGKVIGVVVSMAVAQRLGRTGISYAIPVSHVRRFLTRPDIVFDPPVLGPANIHKPVLFEAKVVPLLPSAAPLSVDLILKPVPGREQSHPMQAAGTSYRVTTVPLPALPGPWRLRLLAQFDNGLLNAITADHAFKVGDRRVRLSEVRSLQLKPAPRVALYDGKVIEGPLSGLDAVPVHLGEQSLPVNLAKAAEVKFAPAVETDQVWYTLAVRQADREIFRQTGMLLVEGLLSAPSASAGPTGIKPPTLEGNPSIRKLAAPVADVAVGGAGRYLVLHLRDLNKLAVFDVSAAEVKGYIPIRENNARYAAGREHVVILLPGAGTMERWRLKTLEREVVTQLPISGAITAVAMGSASDGPLLVLYEPVSDRNTLRRFGLISVDTMKLAQSVTSSALQRYLSPQERVHLRASGNGKVFSMWSTSGPLSGLGVIVAEGEIQSYYAQWSTSHVVPNSDGKLLFTRLGMSAPQVSISDREPQGDCVLPACHGDYYLSLGPVPRTWRPPGQPPPRKVNPLTVRALSNDKPIASFPDLDLLGVGEVWNKDDLTIDKRVHLIPDARLIITIPPSNDRLILRRWDIETSAGPGPSNLVVPARVWSNHSGHVTSVVVAPDGKRALSCGFDKTMRLWDIADSKELRWFHGHTDVIWTVALSSDGRHALSGSQDRTVRLWDVETGKETCPTMRGHEGVISSVVFLPGDKRGLSGCWDQTIRVWDLGTAKEIDRLKIGAPILSVALTKDGKHILLGSNDGWLRYWDLQAKKEVRAFAGPVGMVTCLVVSEDGRQGIVAGVDGLVYVYDLHTGQIIRTLKGHGAKVDCVTLSRDGSRLLSCGEDKTLRLWDLAEGRELWRGQCADKVSWAAFSPDGKRAVSACYDRSVALWDLPS